MEGSRKVITIKATVKEVIRNYLIFTKPLSKLRPKEIDLLTEILYFNHRETPNFKREDDRWKKVFDYESKMIYKKALDIEDYTLQNLLTGLRKKKVVENNQVKKAFIPDLSKDNLMLIFNFKVIG